MFFDMIPKVPPIKTKTWEAGLHHHVMPELQKKVLIEMKREVTDEKKNFANHVFHKELLSNIYKELLISKR